MAFTFDHTRTAAAAATLCACLLNASAQTSTVTITGRAEPAPATIGGFGSVPLARTPLQAEVVTAQTLADNGIRSLAGLSTLDAGLSDAYNTQGYWSYLTVRGFVIDNRYNYRRDGLPINAETALPLYNKERVEILKGTSGMQAGTSAPGGLVNLVVKRPTGRVRDAFIEWQSASTVTAGLDLADRFGPEGQVGVRLNASGSRLRPDTHNTDGHRSLLALATDLAPDTDNLFEFEVESSRQSQPSVPGFSLLGNRVPEARQVDPRTSLNNQPWSLPVVLNGDTASLRWQRRLAEGWRFTAHGATQRLRSDDRVAFPFGCYDAKADVYYEDRYCPDGSFDQYDFRSDGERRRTDALDLHVDGQLRTAGVEHALTGGLLSTRIRDRFNRQAYNYTGSGLVDGSAVNPAAPELTDENTNRDERSTEWYLRDAITLNADWSLWAGLRHTRLDRQSVRTDGSRPTSYARSFTTPWLAASRSLGSIGMLYASWGQGVESEVVPNRSQYTNRGDALPPLKSRQTELGFKHTSDTQDLSIAWFDIRRPLAQDRCAVGPPVTCTRAIDGQQRHRGLEAAGAWREGPWQLDASTQWLNPSREGAAEASDNGKRPTNVPRFTLKSQLSREVAAVAGLSWQLGLVHEGSRYVLPDNSITIPAWTRLDAGLKYRTRIDGFATLWRLGVTNLADHRAWRESPYQFSHAYLFPLEQRTWRASVQASL